MNNLHALFLPLVLSLGSLHAVEASKLDARPDILWIITDDQRPDSLACFNRATTGRPESPLGPVTSLEIDRLAGEGTLFTRAYCNSPSCAPSRASMHMGRYPHHTGIYGFELAHERTSNFKPLIPEVMKQAGYQTAQFGKPGYYIFSRDKTWAFRGEYDTNILPYDLELRGCTDIKHDVKTLGDVPSREEVFYVEDDDGRVREEPRVIPDVRKAFPLTPLEKNLEVVRSMTFSYNKGEILAGRCPRTKPRDQFILEAFLDFLGHPGSEYTAATGNKARGAPTDHPLFVHLGFHFPHAPVVPPEEFRRKMPVSDYKIPAFDKEEMQALPPQLRTLQNNFDCSGLSVDQTRQAIRDYYAFCAFGDTLVGKAVAAFKEYAASRSRPWVIMYVCGDHGWHLGENGVMAKFGPYEKSTRQAVVAASSVPGMFPPGKVVDRFVEFVDFAPTFYRLAGIDTGQPDWSYLDGRDLVGETAGTLPPREYVVSEMDPGIGPRAAIRTQDFVFSMRHRPGNPADRTQEKDFRWALEAPVEEVEMALFDLRKDPLERKNVAAGPAYRELAAFFREKLQPIVLGDRTEVDWAQEGRNFTRSTWGKGADDKTLRISDDIVPAL